MYTSAGTQSHDHAHDRRSPYQLNLLRSAYPILGVPFSSYSEKIQALLEPRAKSYRVGIYWGLLR